MLINAINAKLRLMLLFIVMINSLLIHLLDCRQEQSRRLSLSALLPRHRPPQAFSVPHLRVGGLTGLLRCRPSDCAATLDRTEFIAFRIHYFNRYMLKNTTVYITLAMSIH